MKQHVDTIRIHAKDIRRLLALAEEQPTYELDIEVTTTLDTEQGPIFAVYPVESGKVIHFIDTKLIKKSAPEKGTEDSLHEAIADIAFEAGNMRFITVDSRAAISEFISWAKEFEAMNEGREWDDQYMEEIQEFTTNKINKAVSDGLGYIDSEEEKDLFEDYENLPKFVKWVIDKHRTSENNYDDCAALVRDLEEVGYTCEFGLDAEPYGLKKL